LFCKVDHVGAKPYSLAKVVVATNNFKTMIGKGKFGPMYYGKLEDGQDGQSKSLMFNQPQDDLNSLMRFVKIQYFFYNVYIEISST